MTDLNTLIKKAERQQKQLELNLRFQQNMAFFKEKLPNIYKKISNHQPRTLALGFDTQDNINLLNVNNEAIYPGDPKEFAIRQVTEYIESPAFFKTDRNTGGVRIKISKGGNSPYLDNYQQLMETYKNLGHPIKRNPSTPVGLMIMIGCGLGYQIEELIKTLNIYTLYIYEGNLDSFFASIYTVNWVDICGHFDDDDRDIAFSLGTTAEHAIMEIKTLPNLIGIHKMANPHFYTHVNNDQTNYLHEKLQDAILYSVSVVKTFNRELSGLAASIKNYTNKPRILVTSEQIELPPAFIIGNGPSLDGLLELVKKHQNNVIIISCGSALSALYNNNIKPDFQIDIESKRSISELYQKYSNEEFREDIAIMASGKTHPDLLKLFDDVYLGQDIGEIGCEILQKYAKNKKIQTIVSANPTVSNAALSFVAAMNFQEVYLVGCDYGTTEQEHTHATDSFHHTIKTKKGYISSYTMEEKVKGNFQTTVFTDRTLKIAIENVEAILHLYPKLKCYNPNNGAFVRGATPIAAIDISIDQTNKKDALQHIKKHCFERLRTSRIDSEKIARKIRLEAKNLSKFIKSIQKSHSENEIFSNIDAIHRKIEEIKKREPIAYHLVKSVSDIYMTTITNHAIGTETFQQGYQYYQAGVNALRESIRVNLADIDAKKITQPDDTHQHIYTQL